MAHQYIVSLYNWDNPVVCDCKIELEKGDKVIVKSEFGSDIGTVLDVSNNQKVVYAISRKATERDLEINQENIEKSKEIKKIAKQEAKRLKLEMKIINAHITLGKSNVIITFIADGRVDFRELIKSLSRKIHRSIRMQQIGSRDEARNLGGCGVCGRELCCVRFSGELPSITTEMARQQQISHRGAERISGVCGRLMCCLSYEADQYREILKDLPEKFSRIKIGSEEGEVIDVNALKEEIKVKLNNGKIINVKKEEL